MVRDILKNSGFVENKTFRETMFLKPPKSTYAVYMDSISRGGGDNNALTKYHSITIELYEYAPDPTSESNIEAQLDDCYPLMVDSWEKEGRTWLETEQLYQVVYSFDYIEK